MAQAESGLATPGGKMSDTDNPAGRPYCCKQSETITFQESHHVVSTTTGDRFP
jgi:hypothetical protein